MILLIFAALGGGLATASILAPFGVVATVLAAPLGGGLCAMLAAFHMARQRGPEWQSPADLDEQTDAMVATLRGLTAQVKRDVEESDAQAPRVERETHSSQAA